MATKHRTRRPKNLVTYFGGYASAVADRDRRVHIFRDDDLLTFCGIGSRLAYGTPSIVGQQTRVQCQDCFRLAQEVRRDVTDSGSRSTLP